MAENGEQRLRAEAMLPVSMKLDFDYYQALLSRDPRFDGKFFVAVKTTRIYCRPICRVRTPLRKSCLFMETAAAAERAGFRPCLRCRPELAPGSPAVSLEEALFAAIRARAVRGQPVEEAARYSGFSTRQLRRLMTRAFGVTPVEIMQTERLLYAKRLLQETRLGMSQVALSAGFGSLRRFNALFRARYAKRRYAAAARSGRPVGGHLALAPELPASAPLARVAGVSRAPRHTWCGTRFHRQAELRAHRLLRGKTGWLAVRRSAAGEWLDVTLPASLAEASWTLLTQLRALFDLDANPAAIDAQLGSDPLLGLGVRKHPGLRVPGAWTLFELAVRAILGQQVTVAGASTLAARLAAKFGRPVTTPFPRLNRLAPSAAEVAAATPAHIAEIGLPRARALAVRELASAVERGDLTFGPGADIADAVRALRRVPGVGEWTAQYIAMRALRFPDAFPAADLGLRKALTATGKPPLSEKHVLARSAAWSPWRAYAALHLWQSLHDAEPAPAL